MTPEQAGVIIEESHLRIGGSSAFFYLSPFLKHSCEPNCLLTIEGESKVVGKLLRSLSEAEVITWSSVDVTLDAKGRWEALGFECHCHRCEQELDKDFTAASSVLSQIP